MAHANRVTESSTSLEKDLLDAIERLGTIIGVFICLSDVNESQKMPSFAEMLGSKAAQRTAKLKLLEHVTDKKKLDEFDKSLPEL